MLTVVANCTAATGGTAEQLMRNCKDVHFSPSRAWRHAYAGVNCDVMFAANA
jgi:hypothetical protein